MTISDATPIQFWDIDEDTFNESQPICGLTPDCFCLPFNCDDEIPIQGTASDYPGYSVNIYDVDGSLLHSVEFEESGDSLWQVSINPSELSPALCEKVRFKIAGIQQPEDNTFEIDAGDYDAGLSPWEVFGSGNGWDWEDDSGNGSARSNTIGPSSAKYLQQEFILLDGDVVSGISGELRAQEFTAGGAYLRLYVFDGATHTQVGEYLISGDGTVNFEFDDFTVSGTQTHIEFRLVNTVLGEYMVWMHDFNFTVTHLLKKSDCIDLRNNHKCTKLIRYTNSSDFDDIKYEISPQPVFYLRVPAMLLEDENPMTQEDLELSNKVIVTLRQTIQEKSIFLLGFMPAYLHKKVQKVLMHDTVIIDGIQWKRRDPYEAPRLKDYPLKKGSVLLTKYNSVLKNTI